MYGTPERLNLMLSYGLRLIARQVVMQINLPYEIPRQA